jgi:hypothetical protein
MESQIQWILNGIVVNRSAFSAAMVEVTIQFKSKNFSPKR